MTADTPLGREVLRHSTAHVLAQAVLRLWPGAHYAIGPVIEDGFYYDFELPGGAHFSDEDLGRMATEMRAIMAEDQPFVRHEHSIGEGLALFADQPFKREIIEAVGAGSDEVDASGTGANGAGGLDLLEPARVHRPVPRAPRADHRPARPLRPPAGGRRLLAGRREAPAAPAHLRHGLGVRRGAGRAPAPPGGGRAARPPQARGGARPVLLPRGDRVGSGGLPPEGRHDPPADGGLLAPASRGGGVRVRQHAPHHQVRAVRDLRTPRVVRRGDVPAHGARRRAALLPQADELPVPLSSSSRAASAPTASFRSGCSSSARSTATRSRASCTG